MQCTQHNLENDCIPSTHVCVCEASYLFLHTAVTSFIYTKELLPLPYILFDLFSTKHADFHIMRFFTENSIN